MQMNNKFVSTQKKKKRMVNLCFLPYVLKIKSREEEEEVVT